MVGVVARMTIPQISLMQHEEYSRWHVLDISQVFSYFNEQTAAFGEVEDKRGWQFSCDSCENESAVLIVVAVEIVLKANCSAGSWKSLPIHGEIDIEYLVILKTVLRVNSGHRGPEWHLFRQNATSIAQFDTSGA